MEAGSLDGLWPTKPLSKGSWDGHHWVWGKLLLVLLFPDSSRQSRPARPLGWEREASEVMHAPLYVISRPSTPPPHPAFTRLPFPRSGFLKPGLKLQSASTGPLSLFLPSFSHPLRAVRCLFVRETSTPSLTSHRPPFRAWPSTLWRGAELWAGHACPAIILASVRPNKSNKQ